LQTNSASKFFFGLGADKKWVDNDLGGSIDYTFYLQWKINNRFNVSSRSYYEELSDNNQYVTQRAFFPGKTRYITGNLERKTFSNTFRAEYFATPELSFQLYASPYASVGKFVSLYKVNENLARDVNLRYSPLHIINETDGRYNIDENHDGIFDFSIWNPDFNFSELRSNFVLRWEYRAGSTLYLVWTHNRSHYGSDYDPKVSRSLGSIKDVKAENAFMLKFSYWFSL
jgi:hypothetical protein